MPRIPQGEFDTNISSNVGAAQVAQPAQNGAMNNLGKSLSALTGAMAQLQDQSERTQAYSVANQVKDDYMNKKVQYAAALETVNGSGMADYFDPADSNPDISKRKRIQRPIQEMYKEMTDSYTEAKQKTGDLPRGDIAQELMRQYVGDDLIQLDMSTNKHINRVREKETEQTVTQNMELNLASFTEHATSMDATPESIQLQLSHMNNKMQREIGTVANVLGTDKVRQMGTLLDRAYGSAATQILSSGVTDATVHAADNLVKRIKDPSQRSVAMTRLENTKRATAEIKAVSLFNSKEDLNQSILTSAVLKPEDQIKAGITVRGLMNVYTDPKYTPTFDSNKKFEEASDLMSTLLAKKMLQENITTDMSALLNPASSRSPSGAPVNDPIKEMQVQGFHEAIDNEIKSFNTGLGTNTDMLGSVKAQTIEKMRMLRGTMKNNIVDIVDANFPSLPPRERIAKIQQVADIQGFGDPSLVGKKESTQFMAAFKPSFAKDPSSAMAMFNQQLAKAGESHTGEASYRRAMAIDLVAEHKDMAYLIPMADADGPTQYKMISDAAAYKRVVAETDATTNHFETSFNDVKDRIPALESLMRSSPSLYDGVKQAIIHSAAGQVGRKEDVPSAMKAATEKMKDLYTSVDMGRSQMFALNRGPQNYGTQKKITLERGITQATRLAMFSPDQRVEILKQFNPQAIGKKEDGSWNPSPPPEKVDWYLQQLAAVKPDGRYPNMHTIQINGKPIYDPKTRRVIKLSSDDILKYGMDQEKQLDTLTGR